MRISIKNDCGVPFKIIGELIDKNLELGYTIFNYKNNQYKLEINKNMVSYTVLVTKLDILAKKVNIKDLKFPKIPKK